MECKVVCKGQEQLSGAQIVCDGVLEEEVLQIDGEQPGGINGALDDTVVRIELGITNHYTVVAVELLDQCNCSVDTVAISLVELVIRRHCSNCRQLSVDDVEELLTDDLVEGSANVEEAQ